MSEVVLKNAHIVLADEVLRGSVKVRNGLIDDIGSKGLCVGLLDQITGRGACWAPPRCFRSNLWGLGAIGIE